jgi:hypothetical protein
MTELLFQQNVLLYLISFVFVSQKLRLSQSQGNHRLLAGSRRIMPSLFAERYGSMHHVKLVNNSQVPAVWENLVPLNYDPEASRNNARSARLQSL